MSGIVERFGAFAALSDEDRAVLDRSLRTAAYPAGHVFVREGQAISDDDGAMYLILEGDIEVVRIAKSGRPGVQRTMGPGELFGLIGLVDGGVRTATCRATSVVTASRLDRVALARLFDRAPGVHARFQWLIARQLAADFRNLCDLLEDAIARDDDASLRRAFATP